MSDWKEKLSNLNDDILCMDETYENVVADFISDLLHSERQLIIDLIKSKRIKPVYSDSDNKITTNPDEYWECETCGAFLMEGACTCYVKNELLDELATEIERRK